MVTIKHCLPGGEELIYSTQDTAAVNFVPEHAKGEQHLTKGCDSLFFEPVGHRIGLHDRVELTGGRAYVMNETGATIATYWLGG